MASSHWSNSPAKSIRFFKIVVSDIGSHSKLIIPRKFARILGKNLNSRIYLNAPNGSVWSIDLERQEDEIWLQNGWPEFANFYSICFGHLLVFEYQGDSKFKVLIFDDSASEIDYPLTSGANIDFPKSTKVKKRETDTNATPSTDVNRPRKKTRASSACIEPCHNGKKVQHEKGKGNKRLFSEAEEASLLASVDAFNSKNTFFKVQLCDSYVNGGSVTVPKTFINTYITKDSCNVFLQLSNGQSWPVKCYIRGSCAKFSAGWNKFVQENKLVVGNACVFELVNGSKRLFNVVISRSE